MSKKKTFDMRGSQTNILRLAAFDKEGFIHMVFYRILMPYSVIFGIVVLTSYFNSNLIQYIKPMTILMWVLFTPTAYETVKGFALIITGGLSSKHLSEGYVSIMKNKYHKQAGILGYVPQFAMLLWLIGFILMVMYWQI